MKSKILLAASVLFGLMMINSGLNKFLNYMPPMEMPEAAMNAIGAFIETGWLWPLVAIVEIISGILIMVPKYRALGAIMIFPIMVGILLFNIFLAPSTLPIVIVLLLINLWVIYENWKKYVPMISN